LRRFWAGAAPAIETVRAKIVTRLQTYLMGGMAPGWW
jgi:hypothetical protein